MGKALYRKYRSRSLEEIVGQDHITSTFKNALKSGKLSHAYLLTGPRGVGKTSIARILAHEINGLSYSEDGHMDIIEIDAASNRRIDEIRDLRDKVSTAPTSAKYKVYIIDEVHMLTKEAFNALLKTLEEPPAHVVFILATTEGHKLPQTIISRTQRFTFLPVPKSVVVAHLKQIAKKESIVIDDEALELIAEHGEGSFRDSISLLDQLSSTSERIVKDDVLRVLGRAPNEIITELLEAVHSSDTATIARLVAEIVNDGYDPSVVAAQIAYVIRTRLVSDSHGTDTHNFYSVRLLRLLLDVPAALQPKHMLELALFDAALGSTPPVKDTALITPAHPTVATTSTKNPSPTTSNPNPVKTVQDEPELVEAKPSPIKNPMSSEEAGLEQAGTEDAATDVGEAKDAQTSASTPVTRDFDAEELWQEVLQQFKQKHNTLYGIARMAKPRLEGDTLHLTLRFAFHIKRLKEPKNMKLLTDAVTKVRGVDSTITIELVNGPATSPVQKSNTDDTLSTISNIFGGGELL